MRTTLKIEQIRSQGFKLALFDLDGTLIDSAPDLAAAVDYALQKMGMPAAGLARVRTWVGSGAPKLIDRALNFAHASTGVEIPGEAIAEAYQHFLDYYDRHVVVNTQLYPGAATLLEHWTTANPLIRLGLVTNKPDQFTRPICDHLNISQYFDLFYSGDSFPVRKPDPLPLLKACDAMAIDPGHSIMIGDSSNDLIAARRAGITAVYVSYGYSQGGETANGEADVMVDSLSELM